MTNGTNDSSAWNRRTFLTASLAGAAPCHSLAAKHDAGLVHANIARSKSFA
jgi:hypothetical protein